MAQFSSVEDYEKNNPLVQYSFYANGRVQALLFLAIEIREELDGSFLKPATLDAERIARAEVLAWLWILGAYEVVRTMCHAKKCFSQRAHQSLRELKLELSKARMPAAKMEMKGQAVPITSSRSPAGIFAEGRDLLVGDPDHPQSVRMLLEHFYAVFSQMDSTDVLASHESSYGK